MFGYPTIFNPDGSNTQKTIKELYGYLKNVSILEEVIVQIELFLFYLFKKYLTWDKVLKKNYIFLNIFSIVINFSFAGAGQNDPMGNLNRKKTKFVHFGTTF